METLSVAGCDESCQCEKLAEVEGMNYPTAQRIYDFFRLDLPEKREVLK